jgi:hypothetical protein
MSDRSADPRAALERLIAAERGVTPPASHQAANWAALLERAAAAPVAATSTAVGTRLVPALLGGALVVGLAVAALRPGPPPDDRMSAEVATDAPSITRVVAPPDDRTSVAVATDAPDDPLATIRRAYLELKAGRPDAALAASDRYLQLWPDGMMVEEATAARVLALCALERHADAAQARRTFLSTWPRSLHGDRVRNACKR